MSKTFVKICTSREQRHSSSGGSDGEHVVNQVGLLAFSTTSNSRTVDCENAKTGRPQNR